jgi:cell division protein FtsI (penicillin-binding protein 3)
MAGPRTRRRGASSAASVHEVRRRVALGFIAAGAIIILINSFTVSVVHHGRLLREAEAQQGDTVVVPAARGTIFDRDGVPLAASREVYIVALATREVKDTAQVVGLLREELGLPSSQARSYFRSKRQWFQLPGRFEETTREALAGVQGFYFEPTMRRFYPHGDLAQEILGSVNLMGTVAGGVEQELDSLLAGRNGKSVKRVDSRGRAIPGAMLRVSEPVPGMDVILTIDAELQEIASDALEEALEGTGAAAGEMLIVDPHTGELLAAVSRRPSTDAITWTAATAPYEPGSTIKPFTVASLLTEGRASLGDSIYAEEGSYRLFGRTINDVHPYGWLTLREGFLVSSNIVMAKAASRLQPAMQYAHLRDFGFGMPTGISYPSESGGRLRRPREWSKQSGASLAFGYEISVTPLQLAMAYSAIANGGVLMEPMLVRETRARDGRIFSTATPRALRRVVPPEIAAQVRELLKQVVEQGTGKAASLGAWKVAGKTGTARYAAGGRYIPGAYIATFAGFFPAESPQIVFLVKLDRPRGAYYGGLTAAPVTKATLQAALAARGTPLDRSAVALSGIIDDGSPSGIRTVANLQGSPFEASVTGEQTVERAERDAIVLEPGRPAPAASSADSRSLVEVPQVKGLSLREAARVLHDRGLRVRVNGTGRAASTQPSAGAEVHRGAVVVVQTGGGR